MARNKAVVAIGGSAGGVEALMELVALLPADLPVPVIVTIHVGHGSRSNLPKILTREGPLPAEHARQGEPLRPGRIYVAPPDLHLLVASGAAYLSSGPRVNRHRPAVDAMFASAARWSGRHAVAVVLSGMLDDGAVGAALVARAGGRVLVQDPTDAVFASMPRSALAAVPDAVTAPVAQLGGIIVGELRARRPDVGQGEGGPDMADTRMGDSDDPGFLNADETRLTRLTCPDCNGGLAEINLGRVRYYRCHVGHQYSPRSLEAAQREAVENKLWAAAAALEEHAALARHLAGHHDGAAVDDDVAAEYREAADRSNRTAQTLVEGLARRQAAMPFPPLPPGPGDGSGAVVA